MAIAKPPADDADAAHAAAAEPFRPSEAWCHSLMENVHLGITHLDKQRRIVTTNTARATLFDKTPDEVIGKFCYEEFFHRNQPCADCPGVRALASGRSHELETRRVRDDGTVFDVRICAVPTFAADGAPSGFIEVIEDITDRKRVERELQQSLAAIERANGELQRLYEAAESANRAKSRFLANMSHELRTPLHGILSFSAFGIKKIGTASQADLLRYFHRVRDSGTVLLTMVNDLLDLAKLESGKMLFEFEPANLTALLARTADEFSSMVAQRHMAITLPAPAEEITLLLDADRLTQVFRNLLSNALKFAPEGSVVEVALRRTAETVAVTVSDRGVGIPADELEAVFDEFIQSNKTRGGAGGTGLGLCICRQIIAAHQGRIWAENRPGGGAVLTVELPLNVRTAHAPSV